MPGDIPELKAMADIASVFATLEDDEIQRVLRWATEKYRAKGSIPSSLGKLTVTEAGAVPDDSREAREFADLPALFDAAKPANGLERILSAAYYHQVVKTEPDFDSWTLNTELKHLGYPSANITRDMDRLVSRSPKLVIQTRKEGSTQQARRKFRLTVEGVRAVEAMLKKGRTAVE